MQGNQLIGRCHQIAEEEGIALSHIPGGCHEGGTCEIAQRLTVQRLLSTSGLQHVVGRDALLMATGLPLQPRASRRYRRAGLPAPGQLETAGQDETPLYKQMLRDRIVQFTIGVDELHAEVLRRQAIEGVQSTASQAQAEQAQHHAGTAAAGPLPPQNAMAEGGQEIRQPTVS